MSSLDLHEWSGLLLFMLIGKSLRFSKHAESKSKAAVYVAFELRMEVA